MKKMFVTLFLLSTILISAQDADPNLNKWVPSFVSTLNISQIALENWTKGGDNSLAFSLTGDFYFDYKSEDWTSKNQLKASYGRTKLGKDEIRTTDNDLYIENVISRQLGWVVDPYFSNILRTQLTEGFDYKVIPKLIIADFFDPGYITQSLGFTYNKSAIIQTRLGIAIQETFTKELTGYSDDPETLNEVEDYRLQTGVESVTDVKKIIAENIQYTGKLRLFSRFETIDVWDVRWDNAFTAKVNNWLNVNMTVVLIHEVAQSKRTQLKEALQIGFVYTIF
ncbi:MAG: DUF3078 domain-containing protein [Bacteroidetes bacterium]|nr:DUF3078 domain-containing protein [Bacteroidota bacterium]